MPKLLTEKDVTRRLGELTRWTLRNKEITKDYKFSDFIASMAFVNFVAAEAEKMDHHPEILIQYNKVKLTLSTHSAGGLTSLDFELAEKIDV